MSSVKIRKILVLMIAIVFTICFSWSLPVSVDAGNAGVYIEKGDLFAGEELSIKDWNFSKGAGISRVEYKGAPAVSINTSDVGKLLTALTPVKVSEGIEETLKAEVTLSIVDLIEGNKFGFVFGSPKLKGAIDAEGTTFIWFEKSGAGFRYGVNRYEEDGERILLAAENMTAEQALEFAISIKVSDDGKLEFKIGYKNGVTIEYQNAYVSADKNDVDAAGFLGFVNEGDESLTETTEIYITHIDIVNQFYDKPTNSYISRAKFTGNEFNTQEWFLVNRAAAPSGGLFVDDGVLKFDGSGQNACFGTIRKYSNFMLEYDLFDVKNEATVEADGWINSASQWSGVVFGIEGEDFSAAFARNDSRDSLIYFYGDINKETGERSSDMTKMGFIAKGKYIVTGVQIPDKFSLFKKGFTDKVRVRLIVIDGRMTVSMKLVDEFEYTEIYSYEFENGYTPSGYISIHGEGNQYVIGRTMYQASYFSVDNILLANFDKQPSIVKVGYTSNVLKPVLDYDYIDTWTDDYLIINTNGKGTK